MSEGVEFKIDEFDIRQWFMHVELAQAQDTFRVVRGIIEAREQLQPKRKRRSDAGMKKSRETEFFPQDIDGAV